MRKRFLSAAMAVAMACALTACGGSGGTKTETTAPAAETKAAETKAAETKGEKAGNTAAGEVTLKVFTNLPDRTSGQGLVEQTLFDAYMTENPNVKIDVEALDDEAYKTKFKAYAAGSQMPDLVSVWGQPGFIDEVMDAGLLAE